MTVSQKVTYFRLEKFTEGSSSYYAPHDFNTGTELYFGYDIGNYTIKYEFTRDIDTEPDSCTLKVDKTFFNNPLNLSQYKDTTDPSNAFTPTENHIIIIGNPPDSVPSDKEDDQTYCYEDESNFSGPVFFYISSVDDSGADYYTISGKAFLKLLNDTVIGDSYLLNETECDINDFQVYYEYNLNKKYTSSPYFAPTDSTSFNSTKSRYYISKVVQDKNTVDSTPLFPMFEFTPLDEDEDIIVKNGYEVSKIAWRLLQEIGWCRKKSSESALMLSVTGSETQPHNMFINPYEEFFVKATDEYDYYNENTMESLETLSNCKRIRFKSMDVEGLRYDYSYSGDYELEIDLNDYTQEYLQSFNPAGQSILYNLKTLAEMSNMYISVTSCPWIAINPETGYVDFAWDSKVFDELGDSVTALSRWGPVPGFHPKVMIRRNPGQDGKTEGRVIKYGEFDDDPYMVGSMSLVKSIKWTDTTADMINRIQIKYGTGSDDDTSSSYIELPRSDRNADEPYFAIDLASEMSGGYKTFAIKIDICPDYGVYSLSATASDGCTAAELADNLVEAMQSEYLSTYRSNNTLIIEAAEDDTIAETVNAYWNSLDNLNTAIAISTYKGGTTPTTEIYYYLTCVSEEPEGFATARDSQTLNGVKQYKVSMPELVRYSDAIIIADNLFAKLAPPKYSCSTSCSDTSDGEQLPIFKYFNIIDESNYKQIVNDEGGKIIVSINGTATTGGVLLIKLPNPSTSELLVLTTEITSGQTAMVIGANMYSYYTEHVYIYNPDYFPICTYDTTTGYLTFDYAVGMTFVDETAFTRVYTSVSCSGITIYRTVTSASLYKQVTYDEELMLQQYAANSTSGSHTCVFGLPEETLANIINQTYMWIGDIEKGTL